MLYDRLNAEVKKGLNDELELYPTVNGGVIKSLKEKKGIGQLTLEEVFAIKAYSKKYVETFLEFYDLFEDIK